MSGSLGQPPEGENYIDNLAQILLNPNADFSASGQAGKLLNKLTGTSGTLGQIPLDWSRGFQSNGQVFDKHYQHNWTTDNPQGTYPGQINPFAPNPQPAAPPAGEMRTEAQPNGQMALALMQALLPPGHHFVPVDHDPFAEVQGG